MAPPARWPAFSRYGMKEALMVSELLPPAVEAGRGA